MVPKKQKGTVYVMVPEVGQEEIVRVGHHMQTNKKREIQVTRGSNIAWRIPCNGYVCVSSKLQAMAVEALAHAILEKYECRHPTGKKKPGTDIDIHRQVFKCSRQKAKAAIDEAVKTLNGKVVLWTS
jgi:hypothetical protein